MTSRSEYTETKRRVAEELASAPPELRDSVDQARGELLRLLDKHPVSEGERELLLTGCTFGCVKTYFSVIEHRLYEPGT